MVVVKYLLISCIQCKCKNIWIIKTLKSEQNIIVPAAESGRNRYIKRIKWYRYICFRYHLVNNRIVIRYRRLVICKLGYAGTLTLLEIAIHNIIDG